MGILERGEVGRTLSEECVGVVKKTPGLSMGRWHTQRFRSHKHNFHPPFILCLSTEDRFIVHDPVNIRKNNKNLTEDCFLGF